MRSKKRLVFVGGGHAHIYSLRNVERFIQENTEIILIGPNRYHYYSGMGPGMLSRIYKPEQIRFDIQAMVESRGGKFIKSKVASIEAENRTLVLEGGENIDYDLVSFNVGSHVPIHLIPGAEREAFTVKPIESLERFREAILDKMGKGTPKILIIGGGPAGVELAGNIWRLVQDNYGKAEIILANSTDHLLSHIAEKAGRLSEEFLLKRGIRILSNFLAISMNQGFVRSRSGDEIAFDAVILAIGIRPSDIFLKSGIETSRDGALLVNDYLQSKTYPEIFGGGDCIAIQGRFLDRAGVYAVRESPILFHNLLASLRGEALKVFSPQKRYMLIFNMGNGMGIFIRGSIVWKGKLAFTLKNYIDMSFMSKFQRS